jgi:flagellar assembly factor FliW
VGFPELTDFALIHDSEKENDTAEKWLQSMQEAAFAMPVVDPLVVKPDYNPEVEDELLKPIGELNPDSTLVLVSLTVPSDITKMTVNLQAPIVVNAEEMKACQIIVDTEKYPVRFPIYDIMNELKKEGK